MNHKWVLVTLIALFSLVLSACGAAPTEAPPAAPAEEEPAAEAPAEEAAEPEAAEAEAEAEMPAEEVDFISWYQYDQNNEDPASDERVGNEYLRTTISQFNEDFEGKWNWVNQPKAFDKMSVELVAAVQAGGEVPDLFEMQSVFFNLFYKNGTMTDMREWAEAQPWFTDLDPAALALCTGPDGGIYCIPVAERPHLVYVWADHFPEGFPETPEEFIAEGERLKEEGNYVMTFFGSTDFDGEGTTRAVWTTMSSFGGSMDDGQGNMVLNTPENVSAVEFLREIVQSEYVPEIAFAGGFQEEEAFKDASAASFPTGLFGYRYVNPLTAPDGTEYSKGSAEDMLDAIAAGDVILSPFVAPEGQQPGCGIEVAGLSIPASAENPEAAQDYINWIMSPEQNADWVLGPGGGFPALRSTLEDELFQSPFYQEAAKTLENSNCRVWYGSLERPEEAQKLVMTTVYRLIKEDPAADIAEALEATAEEYNAGN
jgi:multiple sugar transport system substrate-binding protein